MYFKQLLILVFLSQVCLSYCALASEGDDSETSTSRRHVLNRADLDFQPSDRRDDPPLSLVPSGAHLGNIDLSAPHNPRFYTVFDLKETIISTKKFSIPTAIGAGIVATYFSQFDTPIFMVEVGKLVHIPEENKFGATTVEAIFIGHTMLSVALYRGPQLYLFTKKVVRAIQLSLREEENHYTYIHPLLRATVKWGVPILIASGEGLIYLNIFWRPETRAGYIGYRDVFAAAFIGYIIEGIGPLQKVLTSCFYSFHAGDGREQFRRFKILQAYEIIKKIIKELPEREILKFKPHHLHERETNPLLVSDSDAERGEGHYQAPWQRQVHELDDYEVPSIFGDLAKTADDVITFGSASISAYLTGSSLVEVFSSAGWGWVLGIPMGIALALGSKDAVESLLHHIVHKFVEHDITSHRKTRGGISIYSYLQAIWHAFPIISELQRIFPKLQIYRLLTISACEMTRRVALDGEEFTENYTHYVHAFENLKCKSGCMEQERGCCLSCCDKASIARDHLLHRINEFIREVPLLKGEVVDAFWHDIRTEAFIKQVMRKLGYQEAVHQ